MSSFFRSQIEANKLIQYSLLAEWRRAVKRRVTCRSIAAMAQPLTCYLVPNPSFEKLQVINALEPISRDAVRVKVDVLRIVLRPRGADELSSLFVGKRKFDSPTLISAGTIGWDRREEP